MKNIDVEKLDTSSLGEREQSIMKVIDAVPGLRQALYEGAVERLKRWRHEEHKREMWQAKMAKRAKKRKSK